jgi:hypothetical protein
MKESAGVILVRIGFESIFRCFDSPLIEPIELVDTAADATNIDLGNMPRSEIKFGPMLS